MQWLVRQGDILDEPADVLICSANPYLTLSGGVGGALLLRYGPSLQAELHAHLARAGRRFVDRGTVVVTTPAGAPYRAIVHAVAVNGLYESSADVVAGVAGAALRAAARLSARSVALTALATGYGKLTVAQFGEGLRGLMDAEFDPVRRVTVVVRRPQDVDDLRRVIPERPRR